MNLNKGIQANSFLLKGLNITDIHKQYKQGYFNRPIPIKQPLKFIKKNKIESKEIKQNDTTFYKSIQLSGQKYVELYTQHKPLCGGRCDFCKCDFTTDIIGYPIHYEEQQVLTDQNVYHIKHLFWVEGCFHSYECCLAYINKFNHFFYQNYQEFNVKVMFKYMYSLLIGDFNKLKPAHDSKLLCHEGGSMTLNEWSDVSVQYERTNDVIRIPAQVIYTKI